MSLRNLIALAILAMFVATVAGQQLPFRATGDFYVTDFTNDEVYRFQDLNNDGDVQDAGEQIIFYSDASPGPDLATPTGMTVSPLDGSVWISDVNLDVVLRLQDKNGDGDANDAGEFSVFYDNTGAIQLASANDLAIDPNGIVYLAVAGTSANPKDQIVRLETRTTTATPSTRVRRPSTSTARHSPAPGWPYRLTSSTTRAISGW